MPPHNEDFKARLSKTREIDITVTGRKSGRKITNPVWFVVEGENLYLVPVEGSDTQWYKNVLSNPSIRVDARGAEAEFKASAITDAAKVSSVVEKFREKYGAGDVKKYYPKHDVALLLKLH
jgi:deazaflavin-dependent oxidoreductase (nitroreductase family)